ncbi:hypothetical protein [Spirosoma pulveris]
MNSTSRVARLDDFDKKESNGYVRANQNKFYLTSYTTDLNRPVATITQTFWLTKAVNVVFEMN